MIKIITHNYLLQAKNELIFSGENKRQANPDKDSLPGIVINRSLCFSL